MGNEASNNACESIVNGSNPRYTYSQPTPSQQLGWFLQKEEKARQEQYAETGRQLEAQNRARLSEPYQHPTSTYRPIQTTSISTPSPSFTTPTSSWTPGPYVPYSSYQAPTVSYTLPPSQPTMSWEVGYDGINRIVWK